MTHPHRCRPRRGTERGSATLEMVVMLPILFALLFGGLQAALFHHARTLAIAAAQEGARAAAAEHGTLHAGVTAARAFATQVGRDSLRDVTVTGQRTPTTATITVTGASLTVVPGWDPHVTQTVTQQVERLS